MGMTMIVGIVTELRFFITRISLTASQRRSLYPCRDQSDARDLDDDVHCHPLLPLALGIGHGSAMQQSLAIAIISGLICSLPLVLIVCPRCWQSSIRKHRRDLTPENARCIISVSASGSVLQQDQSDMPCRPYQRQHCVRL
jgi:hypothetical protein